MKILITGAAGFIGYHLCKELLDEDNNILGVDNLNDYYDCKLKLKRLDQLKSYKNFKFEKIDISDRKLISVAFNRFKPKKVVNLAAQAGVRYSLENPYVYIESNIVGFLNILELCRYNETEGLIYASSSSVYGENKKIPFSIKDRVDKPISLYAASKKANELIAHSYSHLYGLHTTGLRFFTVYGPWGRPDMALFKFTNLIIKNKKIDIYNNGNMYRDFTYIDDVVKGVCSLINKRPNNKLKKFKDDSLSPVAPFRIVNIGNSNKVKLVSFIKSLESELGKKAIKKYLPIQKGDVKITLANTKLLKQLTGFKPKTYYQDGVKKFVKWYLEYFKN